MVVSGQSFGDVDTSFGPLFFSAYHVVTNEEDFIFNYPSKNGSSNYWVTANGKTGEDANLYMNFACSITINGFRLKNTHNYDSRDRGTNQFKIFTSTLSSGPWDEILSNNLPDATNVNVTDVPTLQFALGSPVTAQFVKFQITSFYGKGGGLQFLSTY